MNWRSPTLKNRYTASIDFLVLNMVIELIALLLPPIVINHSLKPVEPLDFVIVILFAVIYVFSNEVVAFWPMPTIIFKIALIVPIVLLLTQQAFVVAILLLMQYIIYLMTDQTPKLNTKFTKVLDQGVIPLFLAVALLDTMVESMSMEQVLLIAGLYLIKITNSFPFKNFLDFIWPFIGLVTTFSLLSANLISIPATILIVILLIVVLISYPVHRNWEKLPAILMVALTILSQIP